MSVVSRPSSGVAFKVDLGPPVLVAVRGRQPLFAMRSGIIQAGSTAGETPIPAASQLQEKERNIMGDKSPKSTNKKAGQKQAQATKVVAAKKAAVAAKPASGKKK